MLSCPSEARLDRVTYLADKMLADVVHAEASNVLARLGLALGLWQSAMRTCPLHRSVLFPARLHVS